MSEVQKAMLGWPAHGRWTIGVGLGASFALFIFIVRAVNWNLLPWKDDLFAFAPIVVAILFVVPVHWIARLSDLRLGGFIPEQALVIGLLNPLIEMVVYPSVAVCVSFAYFGRSAAHRVVVGVLSPVLVAVLLWHLGKLVFEFCQTRYHTSKSGGSRSLAQAQIDSLRRTRSRFAFCIFLYYIGNVLAVSTVFANIYYPALALRPGVGLTDLGDDVPLSVSEKGAIANSPDAIRALTEVMARSGEPVVIEAGIPSGLAYQCRGAYRGALDIVVAEAEAVTHGRIDPKGIVFRHEHSLDRPTDGLFSAVMHVQEERQPFVNSSDSYFDSFYMSAMTLVSIGLTENYPISDAMKRTVLLEQFVGALFFIVFLGGMVTSLSD